MQNFTSPNFLIISTILIGMINLLTPFITKDDSRIRSFLMLSVSTFFLLNVLILDYLFINGTEINFTLLTIGHYSVAFGLEPLSLIFLTLLATLWIPALLYTIKFLSINEFHNTSKFLLFTNATVLSACIVALSWNLITMFIGYEMITLCTIPLIIHVHTAKNLAGLFKYLKILMLTSLLLFLPAIVIIYSNIGHGIFTNGGFIAGYFSNTATICLLLAFVFGISKAAIFPFHGWLPAAMVASYPVSALLHAVVVVKTGLFCIYKILFYVFGLEHLQALFIEYNWLVMFPAITIIYSSLAALMTKEIKMILAYSTITQLSIALMSAFLLTPMGLVSAIIHMIAHAFTKICMFYSTGNFYSLHRTYKINELSGLHKTMPKTSLVFLISGLSLIGIPPFAGFLSKFYIINAALNSHNLFVVSIVVFSSLCSTIYVIRILMYIYGPRINEILYDKHEQKLPYFIFLSLALCLSVVIGFFFVKQGMSVFIKSFGALFDRPELIDFIKPFILLSVGFCIYFLLKKYKINIKTSDKNIEPWGIENLEDQFLNKISILHNQQTAIFGVFILFIAMLICLL